MRIGSNHSRRSGVVAWAAATVAVVSSLFEEGLRAQNNDDQVVPAYADYQTSAANADLYQRLEQAMTNNTSFANPFTQTELRLEVSAPTGRALGSSFTWYGFHDGDGAGRQSGNVWKFRLLFDHPGTWTVVAGFYVPGTNTSNGPSQTFIYNVSANKFSGEHGHVRADQQNFRRLRHDDGTPWTPFAMHSSMLLDRNQALAFEWIDEHAALGVNALTVRFHAESNVLGDSYRAHFLQNGGNWDYDRYNVATWNYNDQIIAHAQSQSLKLAIWFGISGLNPQYNSYGPTDYPNDATLGPQQKAFIKYLLARWAPFTCFWHWTVDSEYEEGGNGALIRNRAYAAELRAKNPWATMVTTHTIGNWSPGTAPEFDLATVQVRVANTDNGATDCRTFITDNDDYNIPVFNSEGVWSLSNVARSRIATWSHLMAGGFSLIAHEDTDGTHNTSSWGVNWNSVNPRHREDAAAMGKLAIFFNNTPGIDLNPCVPHHELVSLQNGNLALCLANPGESYYIWLDRGGAPRLNLSGTSGNFSVTRYRGTSLDNPEALVAITGGGSRTLQSTPTTGFGNDYLYVVKRATVITPAITVISPNGGETWTSSGTATVTWSSAGAVGNLAIALSADGGVSFPFTLASNTANDGAEIITVPQSVTTQARVRVSEVGNSTVSDISNENFAINSLVDTMPPVVVINNPAGDGQSFKSNITISGTATDDAGIKQVTWQLDSTTGLWNVATGANAWSIIISQPSEGSHTVFLRATDAATPANTSAPTTRTFIADNTGPLITNLRVNAGQSTATVTWTTNEPSSSRVQWGTAPNNYTNDTGIVGTGVTAHTVALSSLTAGTTYHFIVMSSDAVSNLSISSDAVFQTLPPPPLTGTFTWQSDPNSGANTFDEALLTIVVTELNAAQLQVQATADLLHGAADNDYMVNPYVRLDNAKQYLFAGRVGGQSLVQPGGKVVPYTTSLVFNKPASGAWYLGYENYFDGSHAATTNKGGEESGPLGQIADTLAPVISNVTAGSITANTATLGWNTDELADSQVEYGLTASYGALTTLNPTLVTNHTVALSQLAANSTYHYRVHSKDAAGNRATSNDFAFQTSALTDTVAPLINHVAASNISQSAATISWQTNEPADTRVEYGLTTSYGALTILNPALVANHTVTLSQLTPNSTYHYRVRSKDAAGNQALSGDFTFQTLPPQDSEFTGVFTWQSDPNSGANTFDEAALTIVVTELNATQLQVQATADLLNGSTDNDYMVNPYVRLDNAKQYLFAGRVGGQSVVQPSGKVVPYSSQLIFNKPVSGAWYLGYENYYDGSHVSTTNKGGEESGPLGRTVDTLAPVISSVNAGGVTANTATITWNTNELADSQVEYGLTTSYGALTSLQSALVINHSVALAQLTPSSTYHYRVLSKDALGNQAVSNDFTFLTSAAGGSDLTGTFTWQSDPNSGVNTFDEAIITIIVTELNATQLQVQATADLIFGTTDNDYIVNPYVRLDNTKQYVFVGRVGGQSVVQPNGKVVPYTTSLVFNKPASGTWYLGYENYYDGSHVPETNHGAEEGSPSAQTVAAPLSKPGVEIEEKSDVPRDFALSQNFPNPFNMATRVRLDLPEPGRVQAIIYNLQGQEVKHLHDEPFAAGSHVLQWNGADEISSTVSGGVYLLRVIFERESGAREVLTRRLVVMK